MTDSKGEVRAMRPRKQGWRAVQDPIHGFIAAPREIWKIVDTEQFKRLQDLKQLGAVYFVYLGATHNRFEHSIGVMHLAGQAMRRFQRNQPELKITDRDVFLVMAAGLLHDLGHGPFSHMFDSQFIPRVTGGKVKKTHEEFSCEMIEYLVNDPANDVRMAPEEVAFVQSLICPKKYRAVQKANAHRAWIYELIANEENSLDVDKFDYLMRDSRALGIGDIRMRIKRVLNTMEVHNGHICFPEKVAFDIYQVFQMRYSLFKSVYTHKTSRAIECMILDALLKADKFLKIWDRCQSMKTYTHLTDSILKDIERSSNPELKASRDIIRNIHRRKLYSLVGEVIIPEPVWKRMRRGERPKVTADEVLEAQSRVTGQKSALTPQDIVVDCSKINYAMGDENPVDHVRFFRVDKWDPARPRKYCLGQPIVLLHGEVYQERLVRMFVLDREKAGLAAAAFKAWKEQQEAYQKSNVAAGIVWSAEGGDSPKTTSGATPSTPNPGPRKRSIALASATPRNSVIVSAIISPARRKRRRRSDVGTAAQGAFKDT